MEALTRGVTSSTSCCDELGFDPIHGGGESGTDSSPQPSHLRPDHGDDVVELKNQVYGPIGLPINQWC
jgi:hypothetical protein